MDECFSAFIRVLQERLASDVHTTEDSVRYILFAILLRQGIPINDIVLEHPHPNISRAQIDTVVLTSSDHSSIAFEFKYHRSLPGGKNQPRTQHAGAVIADIFRLSAVPCELAVKKYFIYVTDDEMSNYFQNPDNSLDRFYGLVRGAKYAFLATQFANYTNALTAKSDGIVRDCSVTGVLSVELPKSHHARIYEVDA